MIDWTRVLELRDEIGIDDFDEVVELFLSEVEERIEILSPKKSPSETQEDLHFLKGSALNLGFETFANLCHQGETLANSGHRIENAQEIVASFEHSKALFLSKLSEENAA